MINIKVNARGFKYNKNKTMPQNYKTFLQFNKKS